MGMMNEIQFYKEIGLIDDELIVEAGTACRESLYRKAWLKRSVCTAVAACLTVMVLFGTAFVVSAKFRAYVISFFKSEQIEMPIEPKQGERQEHFMGKQSIDGVAQIRYFQFNNDFEIYDNTIADYTADGQLTISKLEGGSFTELQQYRIEDTIRINGLDIPLSFAYVIDNGIIKTFDNIYEPESGGQAMAIWSAGSDFVWVNISIRRELNTYVYYDLHSGKMRDIIGEAGITADADTQAVISPDSKTILVHNLHTAYLIDVEKASLQELAAISTQDELGISFIDDETLSVWQRLGDNEVRYTVYTYNIISGEKKIVFENVPYYSPYGDSSVGISGLGKGITVLVEPERYILFDEKSGIGYEVEELHPDSNIDFLLSPDRKRVSVVTTSAQNGLGITQIGCINLEKQELHIFDRQDFSENYETTMYWMSGNELAVTAGKKTRYLYIYSFE